MKDLYYYPAGPLPDPGQESEAGADYDRHLYSEGVQGAYDKAHQ